MDTTIETEAQEDTELRDHSAERSVAEGDEIIDYHVFCDNKDEYTKSFDEAKAQFMQWHGQGEKNIRLFEFVYANEEARQDDEVQYEDCIMAVGQYPC